MIEVIGIRIVFYFTNNSSKTFLNTKKQKKNYVSNYIGNCLSIIIPIEILSIHQLIDSNQIFGNL